MMMYEHAESKINFKKKPKTITQDRFFKIKTEPKPVQINRFQSGSVILEQKPVFFMFDSVFSVWLGFFLFGSDFFPVWWFVFVWLGFSDLARFFLFGLVFFCLARFFSVWIWFGSVFFISNL
jgi:hypothetical protein